MSGLFLLGLIALWVFVGWLIYRAWRLFALNNEHKFTWKIVNLIIGFMLFSLWFGGGLWVTAGKKVYYDAQIREMCAKDGGVRVYETVTLPSYKFDKWGLVNFFKTSKGELALGTQYIYKREAEYIKRGSPELIARKYKVIRRADNKLLGEITIYSRIGGDLPGPWHPSHYSCSDINKSDSNALIKSIFISSKGD